MEIKGVYIVSFILKVLLYIVMFNNLKIDLALGIICIIETVCFCIIGLVELDKTNMVELFLVSTVFVLALSTVYYIPKLIKFVGTPLVKWCNKLTIKI